MSTSPTQSLEQQVAAVPESEVGRMARRGVFWLAGQVILRNGLAIGTTAILSRILSPGDYGLVGMVATLTAVLQVFSDMGLSWAAVQRRELTRAQVNNLFWLNVAAGFFLWILCLLLAPGLAAFYSHEELVAATIVMGAGFLISGFAVQPMALLRRLMDQRAISVIEIAAVVVGAVTAVICALLGAGFWSLVAQGLATALARTGLVLWHSGWQFRLPVRGAGTRSLIGFGGLMAINGLLLYFSRNLDNILIGHVWGAEALGIYNRAYFLMLLPSVLAGSVLAGLMIPSLSVFAGDKIRFAEAYRRALRMVAWFGMPMAVGLGLTAAPAVALIYGPNWGEVVVILAWLSLAGVTQPIYNTNGWLFTASGRAKAYLWLTILNTIVLGVVFFSTVGAGPAALAKGYGIVMGLVIPVPALWFAHYVVGIPFLPSLKALAPVVAINLGMALVVWGLGKLLPGQGLGPMPVFAIQVVAGVVAYLALTPVFAREMVRKDLGSFLRRKGDKR